MFACVTRCKVELRSNSVETLIERARVQSAGQ